MHRALPAALLLAFAFARFTPAATPTAGTFALQGGVAKTNAYLVSTQIGRDPLKRHFELWLTPPGSGRAIRSYDVDMTQYLHLIVVSDDFRTFLHLHPVLRPDGHFVLDRQLPRATGYHVYADAEPQGVGQQVFRFDVNAGGAISAPDTRPIGTSVAAGPYRVTISSDALKSGVPSKLTARITEHGFPAKNLHPYLGALAHAVFLNAQDLSYLHVHPAPLGSDGSVDGMKMDMPMPALSPDARSASDMVLPVTLGDPGAYRLWIQFNGGGGLYVGAFTVIVR